MNTTPLFVALIATVSLDCASAQTVNLPGVNNYFVTPPVGGAPLPFMPCPSPPVPLSVATSPVTFTVSAATCPTAPGSPVFGMVNLGVPCLPGAICLPPITTGCYGAIPPIAPFPPTPCAIPGAVPTNQTFDLAPGSFLLFSGAMGAGGTFTSLPVVLLPAFVGVTGSTQAFFIDFSVGFVTTEAWDFVIVP